MKLKWYLIVVIVVVTFYIAFFSGSVVERVITFEALDSAISRAEIGYKAQVITKSCTQIQQDSIVRQRYWWIGYRTAIREQRQRILTRSQ